MKRTSAMVLATLAIIGFLAVFASRSSQAAAYWNWGLNSRGYSGGPGYNTGSGLGGMPSSKAMPGPNTPPGMGPGNGAWGIAPTMVAGILQVEFAAGADVLKLSIDDLAAALVAGKTVEAVAAGQGVSIEEVLTGIGSARKMYLDGQVKEKNLTQLQADQIDQMRSAMGIRVLYMGAEALYDSAGGWRYSGPGPRGYGGPGGWRYGGPGGWGYDGCW